MAATYANVPVSTCEQETPVESSPQQSMAMRPKIGAAVAGVLAVACLFAVVQIESPGRGPLRGSSPAAATELVLITPTCAKLWAQCGGDGFDGSTCCEEGSECQDYALESLPSYRQCRKPGPPACAAPEWGSQCANMIQDMKGDSWAHPENYHGLTGDMDDKEFQMFLHWAVFDQSQCPEPCADGTCYFTLHVQGCDTLDSWYCNHDDGSLKFACCCKYFHEEKAMDKPTEVDEDYANAMKAVGSDTPSLFCIAMVLPHGYELDLLRSQYAEGKLGLFGCNAWALYSNESLRITPEDEKPVIKTKLINGSLSATVGGNWGTALNTDVFIRFWDRVIADPEAWKHDWIIKVDPDTMWLPVRLRALLRTHYGPLGQPEPEDGLFLNNCHVGLHGPIEVMSKRAFATYKKEKKQCQEGKVSKIGQEDYFLHMCFKKLGITQVDAYNLMLEATLACQEVASSENPDRPPCFSAQVAFHPFKTTDTWMRCHQEAANHPWALPVVPVTDGPSEANNRHG